MLKNKDMHVYLPGKPKAQVLKLMNGGKTPSGIKKSLLKLVLQSHRKVKHVYAQRCIGKATLSKPKSVSPQVRSNTTSVTARKTGIGSAKRRA